MNDDACGTQTMYPYGIFEDLRSGEGLFLLLPSCLTTPAILMLHC